jgi:hypothetical protein
MKSRTALRPPGSLLVTLLALLALLLAGSPASAVLERVGPVSGEPHIGGYPLWYQDTTGIVLEFCAPNAAELAGGHCLLLTGDTTVPETFPIPFADEHFYFSAGAEFVDPLPGGLKKILWEAAVEAAFAVDVTPGGQMVFTRIRMRLEDVPVSGTYTFLHPYGEDVLEGVAGDRIFHTEDIGVACAQGTFDCAMQGRLGPFLLPADAPGGAELPPFSDPLVSTKLYIADPARVGPVTGGPVRNFVRVEGPPGSNLGGPGIDFIETTDFSLMGRLHSEPLPSLITVDRASYTRAGATKKVDVFATGQPTAQGRLPGQPRPAAQDPVLSFFTVPCYDADGVLVPPTGTGIAMRQSGTAYWNVTPVDPIPAAVCVKDSVIPDAPLYIEKAVTDHVTVLEALYDPDAAAGAGVLTVRAFSSDNGDPTAEPPIPAPVLTLLGFDNGELGPTGEIAVTPLDAPPHKVFVRSEYHGLSELLVRTGKANAPPVALPDVAATAAGGSVITINVLSNDSDADSDPLTVTSVSVPANGTATITGDGVQYDPNNGFAGVDTFVYAIADGKGGVSTSTVTVSVPASQPLAIATFTASPGSPQQVNTPITFSVTLTGGVPNHQTRWGIYQGGAWVTLQDWAETTQFDWTPAQVYSGALIGVWARSAGSTNPNGETSRAMTYVVTAPPPVTITGVGADPASPTAVGVPVTLTVTATGGTQPYQSQWLIWTGTWTVLQDWTTGTSFQWTPTAAQVGTRTLGVRVRSTGNTNPTGEAGMGFTHTVNP